MKIKQLNAALLLIGFMAWSVAHAADLKEFEFGGQTRSYVLHIPPNADGPLPLVINMHGGGGNAEQHQRYTKMDQLANREKFIVVYPNGTGPFRRRILTWNADTCCGAAATNKIDDVGFLSALIDEVAKQTPVNLKKVYATGFSNGAMMAHRLAAETTGKLAAIAAVEGAPVLTTFKPTQPISVMMIHSVTDPRALYEGGQGPEFPGTNHRSTHESVEKLLSDWVKANGCSTPTIAPKKTERESRHTAEKSTYAGCQGGTTVVLWKLNGPGHVWPGAGRPPLERFVGERTDVIDANKEIWEFFKQHALP